jgi:DNA-binding transcriptional ArsR family regulator
MKRLDDLQAVLQTLADANRLRILGLIGDESLPVSDIVKGVGLSQPLVSHHLRVMKERGLLSARRQGPFVLYAITDPRLLEILGVLDEMASKLGGSRPTRAPAFQCPTWWDRVGSR